MTNKSLPNVDIVELLGVKVNLITVQRLIRITEIAIKTSQKIVIGNHNLHSVYLFHHDQKMCEFYEIVDFCFIDGMPIIWINNLFHRQKLSRKYRITSIDWIKPLFSKAQQLDWKIYYLGSKPEVVKKGIHVWKELFPNLQIDFAHGYFNHEKNSFDNKKTIERINEYRPDILFVGMGMPLQERWILENYSYLTPHVIFPIGALVDYYADAISTPPRLLSKYGFEWLFRLLDEPERLWKRYLVEPWFILKLFVNEFYKH